MYFYRIFSNIHTHDSPESSDIVLKVARSLSISGSAVLSELQNQCQGYIYIMP